MLELVVARNRHLQVGRDRVDVGVLRSSAGCTPRRASANTSSSSCRARSGPSWRMTASSASIHSAVSIGSMSGWSACSLPGSTRGGSRGWRGGGTGPSAGDGAAGARRDGVWSATARPPPDARPASVRGSPPRASRAGARGRAARACARSTATRPRARTGRRAADGDGRRAGRRRPLVVGDRTLLVLEVLIASTAAPGDVAHREPDRADLQRLADEVRVSDRVLVDVRDERAELRDDRDEPLIPQPRQRVPDRRPADADQLRELVLGEPPSRLQLRTDDRLASDVRLSRADVHARSGRWTACRVLVYKYARCRSELPVDLEGAGAAASINGHRCGAIEPDAKFS